MTPEKKEHFRVEAVRLKAEGITNKEISIRLGISKSFVAWLFNPEKHEIALERSRIRQRERAKLIKSLDPLPMDDETRRRRAEIEALIDAIPQDTRSKTARLAGDPLPGRSALDQRRAAAQKPRKDNIIEFRRAS
ncbi:hypothetical protein EHE22_08985 [Ochrobactrum pseudogrignonense]|uniref:Uncharacterized protein n=1 Tax=Brucella pseudogrignonensis TaxID=419475 RepID=A0A7Y3T4B1_9HYPH|nr:hypothetical protein [Brucella pseudogrignonensis]NNV20558.1 hypothetical protein [Brucella pseudogrignonensis]